MDYSSNNYNVGYLIKKIKGSGTRGKNRGSKKEVIKIPYPSQFC